MGDFSIAAQALSELIGTTAAPIILDVRRQPIYQAADRILPTARWRDHRLVSAWAAELGREIPIVVYCVHGHNVSQLAAAELRSRGLDARVLDGGCEGWFSAKLPSLIKDALPDRDEAKASRWITRVRPKIDRIACPWLISRFIDRSALFQFVDPAQVLAVAGESGAIAYDIEGAPFTHDGPLCTFDSLIRAFGIADPALDALACIVRGADTARLDIAPQSAGLLAVSLGISQLAGGDDHAALARGFPVYDALYAWLRSASAETHSRPTKTA